MSNPEMSRGRRRAILTVAIGTIALETALLGVIAPLLPDVKERTGAGDATLGMVLAAYALPTLLFSIPAGRLVDRIGRRPLLLSGLVLTGMGAVLVASSRSIEMLLFARAIQGLGATASWVAALTVVSDLAPPNKKGEAIGFALSANSFGAIAGPALGGIAGGTVSFEAPFVVVATIAATMFLVGLVVVPRALSPSAQAARSRLRTVLGQRSIALPAVIAVAAASLLGLVEFVVPLDMGERLDAEATTIGVLFAVAAGVDALAAPFAGRAGDRRGRRPVVVVGWVAVGASGAVLLTLPGLVGLGAAVALFGLGQSIVFAGAIPWLEESVGKFDRGLAYGALNLVFAAGYTVGPLAAGWVLDRGGPEFAYGLIVAVAAVAPLLARHPRRLTET